MSGQYIRLKQFQIDADNSDEENLYVDIEGKGTVAIKSNQDGVSIDVYPFHVVEEPISTLWLTNDDFMEEVE